MEIQNNAQISNVAFKNQNIKSQETKGQSTATTTIKDGNNKLKYALAGLGAIAAAGIGVGVLYKTGRLDKFLNKGTEQVQQTAQKATQEVQEVAQQAAQEAQEVAQQTVQKEAAKVTPAAIASEKHLQQQKLNDLLTGEKANKSAKSSAAVFEEAFNKVEEENAQKALEAATGKKSGIVADGGYQQMYKDLTRKQEEQALLDLVTGQKSGESAQAAAAAFKHAPQSISEKIADVCSYKGIDFIPNRKIEQKLKKMSPEVLENLNHRDIMRLLETPNQPKATKNVINMLSQLEKRI